MAASTSGQIVASLNDVRIDGTPLAISAANRVRANMRDLTLSHNTIGVQTSGVDNILNIDNMMVSFSGSGVLGSAGSTVRISNSVITQNLNGLNVSGGSIVSMSGNKCHRQHDERCIRLDGRQAVILERGSQVRDEASAGSTGGSPAGSLFDGRCFRPETKRQAKPCPSPQWATRGGIAPALPQHHGALSS